MTLTFAKRGSIENPDGLFNASLDGDMKATIDIPKSDETVEEALVSISPTWSRQTGSPWESQQLESWVAIWSLILRFRNR